MVFLDQKAIGIVYQKAFIKKLIVRYLLIDFNHFKDYTNYKLPIEVHSLQVVTIDARNHGDSPHTLDHSYHHMTEDIALLLKDLQINKIILIGHSMGGGTVMYTALSYPELVDKLIVVDFCPTKTSPNLLSMIKLFDAMRMVALDGTPSLSKARKLADEQLSVAIRSNAVRQVCHEINSKIIALCNFILLLN